MKKQSYTKFCLKFNDSKDGIIIDKLWELSNKTEYIRNLIKEDLKKQKILTEKEENYVRKVYKGELKRGEND